MSLNIDPRITHPTKHKLITEELNSVQVGGVPSEVYTDDILDASFFFWERTSQGR